MAWLGLTVVGAYMSRRKEVTWAAFLASLTARSGAIVAVEDEVGTPQDYEKRCGAGLRRAVRLPAWPRHRALEYAALLPQDDIVGVWMVELLEQDPTITLPTPPGHEGHPVTAVLSDLEDLRVLIPGNCAERTLSLHRFLRHRLRDRLSASGDVRGTLLDAICGLAERRGPLSQQAIVENPAPQAELKPLQAASSGS